MTAGAILRRLSPSERNYAARELYTGFTVRVIGRLDLDALRNVHAAVCRAHPQFATRLEQGEDGPVFVECDGPPEIQVFDGDPERPLTYARLDQRQALSAMCVVRDGDDAAVTLVAHHSIADGAHIMAVLATLWSGYTDAVHGRPVELPRQAFPRSLEDILAERGIEIGVRAADTSRTASASVQPTPAPAVVRRMARYLLTEAQTTALAQLCHREHVTMHGVLSGAVLLAEAEVRDLPLVDLAYRYTVNLRAHLTPRVGASEGTSVLGMAWFGPAEDGEPDVVGIGRAIARQRRARLADGSLQRSLVDPAGQQSVGARPLLSFSAAVSMTNWGPVPPLRAPEGLRLTRAYIDSRGSPAPGTYPAIGGYVVATFGGRVGIDLSWPDEDPTQSTQQSDRLDGVREQLDRQTARS